MGGKSDQRIFSISKDMNDPAFMEYIQFMRFYLWTGSQQELNDMRANEIARKQHFKIPFNDETAFQGTQCAPRSSKSETVMWEQIQA